MEKSTKNQQPTANDQEQKKSADQASLRLTPGTHLLGPIILCTTSGETSWSPRPHARSFVGFKMPCLLDSMLTKHLSDQAT